MALPTAAASHYRTQQRIAALVALAVTRMWRKMTDDFDTSWSRIAPDMVGIVADGQFAAARTADVYLAGVLYETGQVDLPAGAIAPAAFAGISGDGRPLDSLLYGGVAAAKHAVDEGLPAAEALAQGGRWLSMATLTAIADAGREAVQAGIGSRPAVSGWVRMLNPPSCSRCVILAGKWFRWNQGFQRHPRCDCRHIPSSEQIAGDFTTDPYEAFKSMTTAQQDKAFGRIEARAIRDGGDIYRVVNIGQRGLGTARSAARYGTPSRMTVDDIYRVAGTRTNAIQIMTEQGYITGPQVAGGNILGQVEGFGQFGRGGTRVGASNAVREAQRTGVRDPLNRYTMTAAERRLYDAHLMQQAVAAGRNPWISGQPLTIADRELAARIYLNQLEALSNQPAQVQALARRLGII